MNGLGEPQYHEFVEGPYIECVFCKGPTPIDKIKNDKLCGVCNRNLHMRTELRDSTVDRIVQDERSVLVQELESSVPADKRYRLLEKQDKAAAERSDPDYHPGDEKEKVWPDSGKRRRGDGNKAILKRVTQKNGKSKLRMAGSKSTPRQLGSITPKEMQWCKDKFEDFDGFADTEDAECCRRHLQVLLILSLHETGDAMDGCAYRYGTYASFFMRPDGFTDRSEFVTENVEKAKKVAMIHALETSHDKQASKIDKLSRNYMHGFHKYCDLLKNSKEILAKLHHSN
jgi:hypothetical protein